MRLKTTIAFLFVYCCSFFANGQVDSLLRELESATHDTSRCKILSLLTDYATPAEWQKYNKELIRITENRMKTVLPSSPLHRVYRDYYGQALCNEAERIDEKGETERSLELLEQSIKIFTETGNKKWLAVAYHNKGSLFCSQGKIPEGIQLLSTALQIHEQRKDKVGMAYTLRNMGMICAGQNEIDRALSYYKQSLRYAKEANHEEGLAETYNNLGILHKRQGEFEKALSYNNEALEIRERINDPHGISQSLNNIASIYIKTGELDKALELLKRSLALSESGNDQLAISSILLNMASVYSKKKDFNAALKVANRSLEIGQMLGYPQNIMNASKMLSSYYKTTGDYKNSLQHYETYIKMRDSVSNEETKRASIAAQLQFEYAKKAAADSVRVAEEKKVVTAQLEKEETQRYTLYGGLLLTCLFGIFMVHRFRITRTQKRVIEEQKKTVELQKAMVEEKQKEVLDSIKYARNIQKALITNERYIERKLKELNRAGKT